MTLGDLLYLRGCGEAFIRDHLLTMGAAIWSTPADPMLDYPFAAFVRFCDNHGLLTVSGRPLWRIVKGGSRQCREKLIANYRDRVRFNTAVRSVSRGPDQVLVEIRQGDVERYDPVVTAAHADPALCVPSVADGA